MPALLNGRTAVVTGASSGIGRAIALAYAENGADVVVADLRDSPREGGMPTHEKIVDETEASATFVECDVSDVASIAAAVDAADEFGGVDVMVNNAGIFRTENFLETSEETFDQLMDVNVKGVYFGSQAAAKKMVENGGGSIINMSSMNGMRGNGGYPTYSATKGAVRLLTYSLAHGLGPEGIRVNAIHPGSIETMIAADEEMDEDAAAQFTEMIPQRRTGQPTDVAGVAVFLASDLASYVNGESVLVDGGYASWG
jgi:NAD(P)-dependent dehydrogenase (short-subunit alcohol dehydrogenase family)